MFYLCSGGLTNELYICSLPSNYLLSHVKEKRKVLLRIYGRLYTDLVSSSIALISDIIVFALLSERNVGPKLYAIFPEGRLEELLPVSLYILRNQQNAFPSSNYFILVFTIINEVLSFHSTNNFFLVFPVAMFPPINRSSTVQYKTTHIPQNNYSFICSH